MSFSLSRTVLVRRTDGVSVDRHGNEVLGTTTPVPVKVAGWWVPGTDESSDDEHDARITTDLSLIAPPKIIGQHDEVSVNGEWFRVVSVTDYNNGLWWTPGLEIYGLKRVTG